MVERIAVEVSARGRGSGHAAANSAMRALRVLYNFAADRAPPSNPMPPNPVRLKKAWLPVAPRTRIVAADELPKFYKAVCKLPSEVARDYLLLLLFTGLRRREAAALRWDEIDFGAIRRSTSAGLTNADTGEEVAGSNGQHGYVLARDGADIPRFLKTLHERCWLAGYGWMMVGEFGQYLDRSIIDRMVGAPERLVFEGPPMVEPPLRQDPEKRRPLVRDGGALDTVSVCRPLTLVEKETLKKLKAEAKQGLTVERNRAREAHIERLAKRRKLNPNDARKIVELSVERGILLPNAPLEFDNPELNDFTVADILDDPAGFEGVTLADPIEGIEYGRCKARVMRRGDGSPWIHSFAHGRTTYELRYDASAVRARLGEARDPVQLLLVAYLDAVEEKELVHAIAQHLKVGVRAVEAKLKAARSEIAQKAARETRERRLAGRTDPRARLYVPPSDAPWLPAVTSIDEVLSSAATPPPRNARGIVARVRPRPVLGMHSFTSKTANEEETSND